MAWVRARLFDGDGEDLVVARFNAGRSVRAKALGSCAALVVALVVVSEAAAASPTRASWAAAANRYCTVANAQVRALPKPTTRARLLAGERGILVIAKRETRHLARIPRPTREQTLIGTLLVNSRKQDSIFQRNSSFRRSSEAIRLACDFL